MPCACNGGTSDGPQANRSQDQQFVVTLPSGRTVEVTGEHAARVEVTMAGGGTYRPK